MIVLLIAVLTVLALLPGAVAVVRRQTRRRQERLASTRRATAAAQARAQARARAQAQARAETARRHFPENPDDALTSVIPAIKLPWPTHLAPPPRDGGYRGPGREDAAWFSPAPPADPGPPWERGQAPPWEREPEPPWDPAPAWEPVAGEEHDPAARAHRHAAHGNHHGAHARHRRG
jgi:hypothetical protein